MESFQLCDPDLMTPEAQGMTAAKGGREYEALYRDMRMCAGELLDLMAEGLKDEGMKPDSFRKGHFKSNDTHYTVLRITKYPKLTDIPTAEQKAGVSRISPHRDLGSITLLFQDGAGGLMAQEQETQEWFDVPPQEGAIVKLWEPHGALDEQRIPELHPSRAHDAHLLER